MLVGALRDVHVLVPVLVPIDGVCLGLFFRLCLSLLLFSLDVSLVPLLLGSNRLCYAMLCYVVLCYWLRYC